MTRFPFDAPDFPSDDEMDLAEEERDLREQRCKFCRTRGLIWEEARGEHNRKKWVLTDENGNIHDCRKAVKPSDFPLVPPK